MAQRTGQQNRALWKGFTVLAETLNASGKDMKVILKPEVSIPWTKDSVAEYLFRPLLKAMYQKEHTAEMEKTEEIEAVWETLMRFLMEKHHIEYVDFPSHELGYWETAPLKDNNNI